MRKTEAVLSNFFPLRGSLARLFCSAGTFAQTKRQNASERMVVDNQRITKPVFSARCHESVRAALRAAKKGIVFRQNRRIFSPKQIWCLKQNMLPFWSNRQHILVQAPACVGQRTTFRRPKMSNFFYNFLSPHDEHFSLREVAHFAARQFASAQIVNFTICPFHNVTI